MGTESPSVSGAGQSPAEFRVGFMRLLASKGVSEKARPYYWRHLAAWGSWHRGRSWDSAGEALRCWVERMNVDPRFESWRVRQAVQAVRWAHGEILGEAWVGEVDWESCLAERTFGDSDGIEMTRLQVEEWVAAAMRAGYSKQLAEALGRLVRALRGRNHAYRTAETYTDWVRRFLGRVPAFGR